MFSVRKFYKIRTELIYLYFLVSAIRIHFLSKMFKFYIPTNYILNLLATKVFLIKILFDIEM